MKQRVYTGYGSYRKLREILQEFSPKKIFLVTGKDSYFSSSAADMLSNIIGEYAYVRYCEFESNPKLEDVIKAVGIFHREKCDCIIAVGGGSVMDMGKSTALLSTQEKDLKQLVKGTVQLKQRRIPTVMIPTTAGTGSESTHFSVVYKDKTKYSLAHTSMLPDFVILDPTFTLTLPPYITASTGMDALSQGIESFWSVNSTEESRSYSERAVILAVNNILKCVKNPDKQSRENMLLASNLSGKAINITKTTAPHAISYPITAHFGVAHGHAVGLMLPSLLEYNASVSESDILDPRGVFYVKSIISKIAKFLGANDVRKARRRLELLMREIGLESRLSLLGIESEDDLETIVRNGFNPERVRNNPRMLTENALREILHTIR